MVKPPPQRNATINSMPPPKELKVPKELKTPKLTETPILKERPADTVRIETTPKIETPNFASAKTILATKPVQGAAATAATTAATTQPTIESPPPPTGSPSPSPPIAQPLPTHNAKTIPNPVQMQNVSSQFFKIAKWVLLFAGIGYGIASLSTIAEQNKLLPTSNKNNTKAGKGKSKTDTPIDDAEKDAIYSLFGSEFND